MKLSSDILYHDLAEQMCVECSGQEVTALSLEPPVFYREGMAYEMGKVYIGRPALFPEPATERNCLLICVGGRMPNNWNPRGCCLFSIPEETNLPALFNDVQQIYAKYEAWVQALRQIVHTTADIEALVAATAPVLGGSIAYSDKVLRVMAQCNSDGSSVVEAGHIQTKEKAMSFSDTHLRNSSMREPFCYQNGDGKASYCINIFLQGSYEGMIAFSSDKGALRSGQKALFEEFHRYISYAIQTRVESGRGDFSTLKTVFRELVNCMDVSEGQMRQALSSVSFGQDGWIVLMGRPKGSVHNLPAAYLCANIETSITGAVAVAVGTQVAILIPMTEPTDEKRRRLKELVKTFFGCAGISNVFHDLWQLRFYFNQAVAALTTAEAMESQEVLCPFPRYALDYALSNSLGALPARYMLPEGLLQLWEGRDEQEYDIWNTLKTYLDNEMSGTKTAQDLYIHRTTLQNRLRRIEQFVDLRTAQERMYIRYCIYLCEAQTRLKR